MLNFLLKMRQDVDREFMNAIFEAVVEAGADRLDIPDTVGYATPEYII